jgi:hypothetical protein
MRRLVLGASDPGDASVRSHDDERGEVILERSIQEGEALDVEHVDFVDEQYLKEIEREKKSKSDKDGRETDLEQGRCLQEMRKLNPLLERCSPFLPPSTLRPWC